MKRRTGIALLLLAALSCGQPKKTTPPPAPATRDFPMMEIPKMMTDPTERAVWLTQHFWDRFLAPEKLYACDSLTVNGVNKEDLEKQVGLFATVVEQIPAKEGATAMTGLFEHLEAFQTAHPEGNVFPETVELVSRYFYDPNSPLRSEEMYLPFVSRLAASEQVAEDSRPRYAWDAQKCALNRPGTPAADFTFIDTSGKRRTLYGIQAPYTLLIFGNPDCHACQEIVKVFDEEPELGALIGAGTLKVVDIYIDEEIDLWKQKKDSYPKSWINGYDPGYVIRTDLLYNVRAVPSLYLLDQKKNVLLKDAPENQVFEALSRL